MSSMLRFLLLLEVACAGAMHPPPPPKFDVGAACAAVARRETWKSADGQPQWSYRIKVRPWTVLGHVHIQLHGWDMVLTKNYSAAILRPGSSFTAVLHPQPGLDDTFQIIGTGEPYADPMLTCDRLQGPNATLESCALAPKFEIDSDWESLANGRFRAHVQLDMWVLQTIITMDFGEGTKVALGRDLSGARLVEGGDGTSSKAVISLLALKHCLGMYKDASCNNAFGFSAVVTPALTVTPEISCLLTRHMPAPPPPHPPRPPPLPPPGFVIDPNLCYLGGSAHFAVAPHKVASQAALQTWVVEVHLNDWLPGLRVVLDFPGVTHAEHGLHVSTVMPAEVVRLVSVTRHSAIVELLPTASHDFTFEALGDVDDVRIVCDVGDARPPPPPPPSPPKSPSSTTSSTSPSSMDIPSRSDSGRATQPAENVGAIEGGQLPPPPPVRSPLLSPPEGPKESGPWGLLVSVGLVVFIAYHAKHAWNDPQPYLRKLAEAIRWARTTAAKSPQGRKVLAKVSINPVGRYLFKLEASQLVIANKAKGLRAADGDEDAAPTSKGVVKAKGKKKGNGKEGKGKEDEEQEEPLVGGSLGFDDSEDEEEPAALPAPRARARASSDGHRGSGGGGGSGGSGESGGDDEEDLEFGEPAAQPKKKKSTTTIIIKLGGRERTREMDLRGVSDMAGLQQIVAKLCKSIGADVKSGMRMQYTDGAGRVTTVRGSSSINDVCGAQTLTLLPKDDAGGSRSGVREGSRSKPDFGIPKGASGLSGSRGME